MVSSSQPYRLTIITLMRYLHVAVVGLARDDSASIFKSHWLEGAARREDAFAIGGLVRILGCAFSLSSDRIPLIPSVMAMVEIRQAPNRTWAIMTHLRDRVAESENDGRLISLGHRLQHLQHSVTPTPQSNHRTISWAPFHLYPNEFKNALHVHRRLLAGPRHQSGLWASPP